MKKLIEKIDIFSNNRILALSIQFIKFGIVGASNVVLNLVIYYALLYFSVQYMIAYTIAFAVCVCNAYFWNSHYVFPKSKGGGKSFLKSVTAYGSTYLLSIGLLYALVELLNVSKWISPLFVLCITMPVNFILHKYWVFKGTGSYGTRDKEST